MSNLIYIKRGYGFTLVELLIAVSIIGILAGVTVSVLNPQRQRMAAEDGVRRANLDKMITGIEAFNSAEGRYPNNKAELCPSTYVTACPDNSPTTGTTYDYSFSGGNYGVIVNKASGGCLKYRSTSSWGGKIQDCGDCSTTTDTCATPTYTWSGCGMAVGGSGVCAPNRWGATCTTPGATGWCSYSSCMGTSSPCGGGGSPIVRWECICQ